ncbi:hypothetical protein Cci01nite_25060 [Catellatospora citrea]|uniref:Uncharacterized protein n=1 Tax=Catellatospora citrea TaxID=53366 RepID=A0A8J3K6K0_9ACTN|nr:hypothetical protein Cci01nite_25060 [Catellatospora citrea]
MLSIPTWEPSCSSTEAASRDVRSLRVLRDSPAPTGEVERDREIVAKYEEGLGFHRSRIEADRYELGELDERLGA